MDHALHLSSNDPVIHFSKEHEPDKLAQILITPGDPTTEVLAACFMAKLNSFLEDDGGRLRCVEVKIEETPTNSVVSSGHPDDFLPSQEDGSNRPPWWKRPDMSINDLDVT